MILAMLKGADEKGELILIDGGFCRYHIRKDGQLTIYDIYVLENKRGKGIGREMLKRLEGLPVDSLFARCPVEYASNSWWKHMGFVMEGREETRGGTLLNLWRKEL